jgi:5'-nucleotidase
MPTILVTNDDGVHSDGIRALADAVRGLGELFVVAPIQEASAIGHALTLRRPLRIDPVAEGWFAVDGTPTDCVNIAITHVIGRKPDLIVSGINKGWNRGDDVTYSGTVSAALEGALLGIPSVAFSVARIKDACDFTECAEAARTLAGAVLEQGMPKFTLLNVNAPVGKSRGFRVTVQAKRNHQTVVSERGPSPPGVLDREARTLGAAGQIRLSSRAGRLHLGDAAATRHDRLQRAGLCSRLDAGRGQPLASL